MDSLVDMDNPFCKVPFGKRHEFKIFEVFDYICVLEFHRHTGQSNKSKPRYSVVALPKLPLSVPFKPK